MFSNTSSGSFVIIFIFWLSTTGGLFGFDHNNINNRYSVDGIGERRVYDAEGTEIALYKYEFKVLVNDCRFQIIFNFPKDSNKTLGIPRYEWLYNGTNLLHSVSYPDESASDINNQKNDSRISCNAFVLSDSIPGSSGAANANLIWLIFASECDIRGMQVSGSIRPPWQLEYVGLWETGFTLPYRTRLMDAHPRIPEEIYILNDGKIRFLQHENDQIVTTDAPKPYSNGFTNALIKVTSILTTNGLTFPSGISFTRWFPDFNNAKNPGGFFVAESELITVNNVSFENCNLSLLPKLKAKAILFEQRPASKIRGFQVAYGITTNGSWPLLSDSAVKMLESEWLRQRSGKNKLNPSQDSALSRFLFAAAIIFVTALSIFVGKKFKNHQPRK
jgi:hypothetical protein